MSEEDGSDETSNNDLYEVLDEIINLNKEINENLESARKQSQINRVQRAHLIVAIGVVGAFATLYTPPKTPIEINVFWSSTNPIYPLFIHALLFMIYIPIHLYVVTARTLPKKKMVDQIGHFLLPFVNLFFLMGSLPLVLLVILEINLPTFKIPVNGPLDTLEITAVSYIILEAVLLTVPAFRYAAVFKENMEDLQTGSSSKRIRVGSGSSGDIARVTVKNSHAQTISGEDVRLEIETPRGIEVENVQHAIETDNGYKLHDDLEPEESIRIPIELQEIPGVKFSDYHDEEIKVDIFIDGEEVSTEQFTL